MDTYKPLRVLMCNYEYPPLGGGAANANECLLREFVSIGGVKIDLVTSFAGKGIAAEKLSEDINVYKVGIPKKNLHRWRKIEVLLWLYRAGKLYKKLLADNDYDLAHCFFAFPSGYLCYRHRDRLPYLISLRGSDVPGYNSCLKLDYILLRRLFKNIWKNAASIVANSSGLANLAADFAADLEIEVIPNGVNIDEFSKNNIQRNSSHRIKLLAVGRLVNRKRVDIAIKAIEILGEKGVDASLDIAGDGVMAAQLRSLAEKSKVADRVNFLKIVSKPEIPALYAAADIFVMCSEHEGMSNAVLEAMASGLPIITSNCEGISELIGENGIVLDNTTPKTLADAVCKLVKNDDLRKKMGDLSRQRANNFSWQSSALAYMQRYERIKKMTSKEV